MMFETVKGWLSGLNAQLRAFFGGRGGQVLKAAAAGLIQTLGPVAADLLLTLADQQVAKLEGQSGLSGVAKKNAAVAGIVSALKTTGREVAEREINFAIEAAVQKLNAPVP